MAVSLQAVCALISPAESALGYEYGYYWHLYQDGTIEYEVKLIGVISNGALPPGQRPAHGTLVAPQVYGPNHQHIFCVRLDMMVDGPGNTVPADPRAEVRMSANACHSARGTRRSL